jgi:hypothetical protein
VLDRVSNCQHGVRNYKMRSGSPSSLFTNINANSLPIFHSQLEWPILFTNNSNTAWCAWLQASTVRPRCCCAMAATVGACASSARPLGTGTAGLLDPLLTILLPLLAALAAARGPMALPLRSVYEHYYVYCIYCEPPLAAQQRRVLPGIAQGALAAAGHKAGGTAAFNPKLSSKPIAHSITAA